MKIVSSLLVLTALILPFEHGTAFAEAQWAGMKGAFDLGVGAVYGTQGVADPANQPGEREGAVSWTDASGALWLFGGKGYDGAGNIGFLNDLWKLDLSTGNWTWMKGSSICDQYGTYGTKGVASPANTPGARESAVTWVDESGKLLLFGGYGYASWSYGYLNDMWRYDPATGNWTWIRGSSGANEPQETPYELGARTGAVSWTDALGGLWLFGGQGSQVEYPPDPDSEIVEGIFNDLWKYDPGMGKWSLRTGSSTVNQPGHYNALGVPGSGNHPGSRRDAVTWTDASGALWLFGGYGLDGAGQYGKLNDLWKFDPVTYKWAWMKGASTCWQLGNYGTLGAEDSTNTPGGRDYAVSWTDASGALWLFGGWGYDSEGNGCLNDLWKFIPETGNWTWIKGSSTRNPTGIYGTQGVPDPANTPGGRDTAVSWTDNNGKLWLLGGGGLDEVGFYDGFFNDLWQFDPANANWTWMKGTSRRNRIGTHGTLGIPDPCNLPAARSDAVSWADISGRLWLFGGRRSLDYLNDLWRYDQATGDWTWMKGSSMGNQLGVYGTQGVPSSANTPGARSGGVSWSDTSGGLWLFGGWGKDIAGNRGYLNDLWKYELTTGNWTWLSGSTTINESGTYGVMGLPASGNTPGARAGCVSWTDATGALWLFGGGGYDGAGNIGILNDLWKYDSTTGNWVWMKGASIRSQAGTYGTLGVPNPANAPGSRSRCVSWTDAGGALWLFGGGGYDGAGSSGDLNDLWKYNPVTGNWAWMKGATTRNHTGVYGTIGVPDPANVPRARGAAVSWTDINGTLWLFGGDFSKNGRTGYLNDLWKYNPATGHWTWMKGASTANQSGTNQSPLGIPDAANTPGARYNAVGWSEATGGLWLFGGTGYDCGTYNTTLMDLWRLTITPDTAAQHWPKYW